MNYEKEQEIPFGAFDSELMHQEIFIPEGFEAEIKGDKIILKKIESEDERIRKYLIRYIDNTMKSSELKSKLLAWLEKQGESYTKKDVDDAYVEGMAFAKDELEKQGEQKPADKVEPKFHKGQWIVWQDKCYKVNYNGCGYELIDQNGLRTSLEYGTVDKSAHLWTIDDAKKGDVLINWNNTATPSTKLSHLGLPEPQFWVHPTTKEECDLLFQKMKESGYEWDAEKKELKKIEPFDKYEGLTDFERTLADICIGWIGEEIGWKQYIKDNADVLLKIAVEKFNSVQDVPFEQKPAWSEEDEKMCQETIDWFEKKCFPYALENDNPARESIKWLKSLKQRIKE